jgi:preprotein translocase subunit YajC
MKLEKQGFLDRVTDVFIAYELGVFFAPVGMVVLIYFLIQSPEKFTEGLWVLLALCVLGTFFAIRIFSKRKKK